MLRVHFTAEDVARVRVAAVPDHLWEISNSFQALAGEDNNPAFGDWRRLVRPLLGPSDVLLAALLPPRGYSPDFLTPDRSRVPGLDSAVEAVLTTPKPVLRADLARLAASRHRPRRPLPAEVRALAEGEPEALHRLGGALRTYYRRALLPFRPHIRAQVEADLAARARAALAGGTDGLLASFRPVLRWEPPVLEAPYPFDRELRLGGRGLLLQPCFFCSRRPVMLAAPSPERTPVLVYPIQHAGDWARGHSAMERATRLGELVGRTRAAILADAVTGRTTGELARRIGISGAAASQHTAVLRRAGLLLSVRRSRYVLHTITPAGLALLGGPSGAPGALFDV
ncbi:helix-turn-helix domain-containing protein [Streptomyces sp. ME02-8801-2C]|uniref:ArsR/SmtB family transcription factor n=1 Tax=Streptomyces sp. ME02-8801-2C TaxID=3028680 RepID=UPI0029BD326F|nr:helix-turn-helix domain-containing protein [Streptomyces sp. ME02-8801-2C]MDX3454496.1 helix-turn-helix domain-containing protein [Streptomyces sp. ME02-8801-2C]